MTKPSKPVIHARDHEHGGADPVRIAWESTGTGATGNAVLFDTFPQDADYLAFDTQSGIAMANHDDSPVSLQQLGNEALQIENSGSGDLNIEASGTGNLIIEQTGTGDIRLDASGNIIFSGLPTSDPGVSGALWNSSGTLKVSP